MTRTQTKVYRLLAILGIVVMMFVCVPHSYAQTQSTGAAGTQSTGNGGTQSTGAAGTQSTGNNTSGSGTLQNPLQFDSLPELLHAILAAVVELGTIVLGIMLVYVGFLFVSARGNPEEISKARSALIWTLIGGLILLGAEAISLVIQSTVASISS